MTPTATYRLQLQPDFPFSAAAKAVPYLAALGVSHLHLSPVLEAVPGSAHGYDVVDHSTVRAELGGEDGLRRLAGRAHEYGLGIVLDIVPNHMATAPRHNKALWEVLREGRDSPYARWFDIDWDAGAGKVLLPVLPGPVGDELAAGELRVEDGQLCHGEQRFPLAAGTEGLPLPELLDRQHYRLAWWRLARTELNYRRFFTISELIGVRVEDPEVFDATHAKILELVRDGVVDGLRIDHPDGLADPEEYLRRLDEATGGDCWTVVEKILTGEEPLPASWPVAGTTGYDALHRIDGVFTDPVGARALEDLYRTVAAPAGDRGGYWDGTVRRAAYKVVIHELAAETAFLSRAAERICAADPALRDHAPWALRTAIRELLVRVPVYRPYTTAGGPSPDAAEAAVSDEAVRQVKAAFVVSRESSAVDVVRELALGRLGTGPDHVAFCARFAQTSSALRAKSVEDTAFYRYVPLISANEVGGDPGDPAVSPERFHAYCARLARDWPTTGTVLTTHDTKRSADVRAGIAVLSECPERWGDLLERVTGVAAPDPQMAWQAWQTAVGFTPAGEILEEGDGAGRGFGTDPETAAAGDVEAAEASWPDGSRMVPALLKSVREAGLHTNWTEGDPLYERAVTDFVEAGPAGPARRTVAAFTRTLGPYVRASALGAALVHLTMPGVPDLYQGTEREYVALVDPDNRAPFRTGPPDEKTVVTTAALGLRRERPEVFGASGTYVPLEASGQAADHCLAFCRSGEVVTAVTRLPLRLAEAGGWSDTELVLPPGRWSDALASPAREFEGGVPVLVSELFADRPVALLKTVRS
ncbi:malto-oligosyltrehalose synthase [Streptomyces sp. SID3212]|uniref:malto-oligosyltrehalose synthase n=1 Tax=Streptomyces sp. SID3212 TaxID=2690259 RepID=UPI00136C3F5B|nr:malto-oligosyltrehalose synthase [Streptomyces sp. SID3212]MYV54610.1 malto-oligosyltrehalose synthase [Streptomyces sp. SID3212]